MLLSQFDYNLPEEKIAKFPPATRGGSRLMLISRAEKTIIDKKYTDLVDIIPTGDALVINTTKVEKVRVFLTNPRNSKKIQAIFLNKVFRGSDAPYETWEALLGRAKNVEINDELISSTGIKVKIEHRFEEAIFIVQIANGESEKLFQAEGHVPLPPYLKREDQADDYVRYNTVFAKKVGSSAAPTAGLNVTMEMLEKLKNKGVEVIEVSLNVGWGTFAPIRTEKIEDHKIHAEEIFVSEDSAGKINEIKKSGGKIWALGTTAARTLESVFVENSQSLVKPFQGDTQIYIFPGYNWTVVDHLITNFHAPRSSLLVMISAFMGYEFMNEAYQKALTEDYKFLSYGDTMAIV